jgi:dipeptidyl aminopeptidase/acylaminoacyl peptidase
MTNVLSSRWRVLTLLVLPAASVRAQEVIPPLPIEVLLDSPTLGSATVPAFSADGSLLAYTVTDNRRRPGFDQEQSYRSGVPSYALGDDVWITEVPGGISRNLTGGDGNNWAPSWSPDGRKLAFLSDRAGGSPGGQTHLWTWDRAAGTLRQASDLPVMDPWVHLGRLEWLADSRTVVVKTYPEGMSPGTYASVVLEGARQASLTADTTSAQVFRFDPTEQDSIPRTDPTNLNALLGALALVNVETGAIRRISEAVRLSGYSISPDRRRLAWAVATRFESPGSHRILVDLIGYDLETGQSRRLVTGAPLAHGYPIAPLFSWSPSSRAIAYRTNGVGLKDQVYLVSAEGAARRRVADGPILERAFQDAHPLWDERGERLFFLRDGAIWRVAADGGGASLLTRVPDRKCRLIEHGVGHLWSPDGGRSTIVFTMNVATKDGGLARVDLRSGAVTQLVEEARWYPLNAGTTPAVTPDGKAVVYVSEDPQHPPNLWLAQGVGRPHPRQLTEIGADAAPLGAGLAKAIDWRSLDGDTIRGALIYPAGYRPGVRYPLIVKLYGGTDVSDDMNRFGFAPAPIENLQVFTSRGYAVLLAESRLRVGTPVLDLTGSVMPGIDKAIDLGVADPTRIGITGHSYGGYNTLVLITQSRRFKAAVMRAGFGDLVTAYGGLSPDGTNYLVPWAERGQGRMGGTPWEVRERYIENSPIFYLDRVQTPLLIIHGGEDWPFLADQVFTGLRRLGKRVEYARYAGEGHWEGEWSRSNQRDYLKRVIGWFDRYLKGDVSTSRSGAAATSHRQ